MSRLDLTTAAPGPADDYVATHDGARTLLTYAVPGARVSLSRVLDAGSPAADAATRRYEITVERLGRAPVTTCAVYSLPVHAGTLARSARLAVEAALSA